MFLLSYLQGNAQSPGKKMPSEPDETEAMMENS